MLQLFYCEAVMDCSVWFKHTRLMFLMSKIKNNRETFKVILSSLLFTNSVLIFFNIKIYSCFQVFNIAHTLTSTRDTLAMATALTLKEFEDDGCCYIELRSTPRQTPHMTISEYIEAIVHTMQ